VTQSAPRRVVALLASQAFAFGLSESLLLIVANAIFLDAYGSKWLPLTYVGIAVVGTLIAAGVARTVRRWPLPRVAILGEAAVALLFVAAWAVLRGSGGVWVSAPLLVLFPVLLQIGFIFVGGQAGRLLDVQQIKAGFPRIVSGFALGFLAGGLAGRPLLALLGSTDHLLLVAAGAQAGFVALLAFAGGRFADRLGQVERSALGRPRLPLRQVLSSRFVLLVIGYQILSAAGTYLIEFVLFDRAAARYHDAASLTRFLSTYTAALNIVDIVFLALFAGMLLRRFGLRLGIAANPALVTVLGAAMLVSATASGGSSLALFVLVAAARIVDISLTDGTTRTSINTAYQLLPSEERLAVQATVEGVGVPVAIGATGVLLFALRAFSTPVSVIVAVTVGVCVVWTLAAVMLYRDYARALAGALRRRVLPDIPSDPEPAETAETLHRLLASDDARDVRLGLDLLTGTSSPAAHAELARLADDPRADVRVHALASLAGEDDGGARARLGSEIATLSASREGTDRRLAAEILAAPTGIDRGPLADLLRDPDPAVRTEALAAVGAGDAGHVCEVIAALDDPATIGAAVPALGRLGDAILPAVAAALANAPVPAPDATLRLVRAVRNASPDGVAVCVGAHVEHLDRELGLTVLSALGAAGAEASPLAASLDRTLQADSEHAARCLAALAAVEPGPLLERAIRDELELLRQRVLALLAVRHGAETIHFVGLGLASEVEGRRSLAIELLEVTLGRAEATRALPIVRTDLPDDSRLRSLISVGARASADRAATLADLMLDDERHWRSAWLQACAVYEARTTLGEVVPARRLATEVTTDPVLRETLEWAAGRVETI
jgi:hypothetical protein